MISMPFLLVLLAAIFVSPAVSQVRFLDVTRSAGFLADERKNHYGGASLADLNGDGNVDIIAIGHTSHTRIYMNNGDGTFTLSSTRIRVDAHGINAFRAAPAHKSLSFLVSRGGYRGTKPNYPLLYDVDTGGNVTSKTEEKKGYHSISQGRGRTVIAVNLRKRRTNKKFPELLFINAEMKKFREETQRIARFNVRNGGVFENVPQFYRRSADFVRRSNPHATVTDIDGDGMMEIVSFGTLAFYRVGRDYGLVDITEDVLPESLIGLQGVRAVTELDFNNDGQMDLYLSRNKNNDLKYLRKFTELRVSDILLKNVGGKYVDITSEAGIPDGMSSQGATVGDFDNDGMVDLYLTGYIGEPDVILRNSYSTRWRKFLYKKQAASFGYARSPRTSGDQPMAADYDNDGRIDVVLAEGDWFDTNDYGTYKLIRNTTPRRGNKYLLVRVKSSPTRGASSLHAVVTVCATAASGCQIRRVGSPGAAVSNSYVETLHFGLGRMNGAVASVTVRWVDGVSRTKRNVRHSRVVSFGY